jgi:hypothetical protein
MTTATIAKPQVVALLLEASPSARRAWEEHLASWNGEQAGDFNDVAVFAHHIVDCYAKGATTEYGALFATLERILREGDEEARRLAAFGVLEDVQTLSSHQPFGPDAFVSWLGPKSREAWDQIATLWRSGGGSLAGVIQFERSLRPRRSGSS